MVMNMRHYKRTKGAWPWKSYNCYTHLWIENIHKEILNLLLVLHNDVRLNWYLHDFKSWPTKFVYPFLWFALCVIICGEVIHEWVMPFLYSWRFIIYNYLIIITLIYGIHNFIDDMHNSHIHSDRWFICLYASTAVHELVFIIHEYDLHTSHII